MKKTLILFSLILSSYAFSIEHGMTNIVGKGLELKSYDHALAGSFKNFLVFANVDESKGISSLIVKKDGGISETLIGFKDDNTFGGILNHVDESGKISSVEIAFVKLDTKNNVYTFKVNGENLLVNVTADGFKNNHFLNPKYSTVIKGEIFEFKIENGEACYNMSAHLIAIMLTLSHI